MAAAENRGLLEWLAKHTDMTRQMCFNAPGGMDVGDHPVTLGHMTQWQLSGIPGNLKLSVPQSLEHEVRDLLSKANLGRLGHVELSRLAEVWELIGADVATEGEVHPAIFLVHRESSQVVVVAAWPPMPPPPPVMGTFADGAATFDPVAYFGCQAIESPQSAPRPPVVSKVSFRSNGGAVHELNPTTTNDREGGFGGIGIEWFSGGNERRVEELGIHFDTSDRCTLVGPFGAVIIGDPGPGAEQREFVRHLVMMGMEQHVPVRCSPEHERVPALGVATGDPVEVEYEGEWFAGVLRYVEGEVAHIHCNVDEPSVMTLAHVSNVRPAVTIVRPYFGRTHKRSKTSCF
jgi:hypothetical protein